MAKICKDCKLSKELTEYYKPNANQCKECFKLYEKKRRETLKMKHQILIKNDNESKKCKKCSTSKHITLFRPGRIECMECERIHGKLYRRGKGKIKSQEWTENNSERMKELQKNWYQNNKKTINEKYNTRIKEDIGFRLKKNYQSRLISAIKVKSQLTCEYLECDTDHLKKWLSYCFTDGMNYENYGKTWHVDHVIPVSSRDILEKDNQLLIFPWFNLSPMLACDNMKKGNRIIKKQMINHVKKLKSFCKMEEIKLPKKYLDCVQDVLQ